MNWQTFKNALTANADSHLQFQYEQNKWVEASYHITEIKQAPIVSVDCGGQMNSWTEVILQLWLPDQKGEGQAMRVDKALSIIELVEKALPLHPLAIVKIEYGTAEFATRQLLPGQIIKDGENLIVDLQTDATQCKAIERGGNCGTSEVAETCCSPEPAEKPLIELNTLATNQCTPGSGCC